MTEKPVILKDIAEKLNVSIVTVSKALREHPDISIERTKTIKKVAKEMGYTPNLMARGLSGRLSSTIGVVIPKIAHFFFSSIIEHIYDIAFQNNYEIILMVSQENAEREKKHIQTLLAMKVDGIIISITQETKDYSIFETIRKRNVPLVFMDRIPEVPESNTVSINDRMGAFKAIEHAISIGYRKICHFAGYQEISIGKNRYLGFKEAMIQNNIPIKKGWVIKGGFGEKFGYDAFLQLYKGKKLPDLIFTVTYPVALGIYQAVEELGIKIPEDIDLICFGSAKVQQFLSPPLSCVNQPTYQIAKESMDILLKNIFNFYEKEDYKNVVIDSDLILRNTCVGLKSNKKANSVIS